MNRDAETARNAADEEIVFGADAEKNTNNMKNKSYFAHQHHFTNWTNTIA